MENFVVSARKYRPRNFDAVVGQSHITTTLKNAIKNKKLAHAFLFCGPRGVGKTTCARILAKTINCENQTPEGEACNECTSCKTFQQGQSLNIHELDAASNNSVDNIRELTEHVRFSPQAGKYKVYIIDEVHMLSSQAFNAFLKTLEEPPPHAIFILATTEKQKILPTILSRCQVFDFKRMPTSETVEHLRAICEKEEVKAESDALQLIAQKSEGCMRDALSILDKLISFTGGQLSYKNTLEHLNILDYEYFFKVSDAILEQDVAEALLLYDEILQKGFEGDDFLEGYAAFLRDLMVSKDKRAARLMEVTDNLKKRYETLAARLDTGFLVSALNVLNDSDIQYQRARNRRLLVEMTLIRLSYLQEAVDLISDEKSGAVVKKKVADREGQPIPLRSAFIQKVPLKKGKRKTEKKITDSKANKQTEYGLDEKAKKEKQNKQPLPTLSEKEQTVAPQGADKKETGLFNQDEKLDLEAIRKKIKDKNEQQKGVKKAVASPLEEEVLQQIWKQHIESLKKKDKKQAANIMGLASIHITGEEEVEIRCRNPVQKSFINDQKIAFAEKLKARFHNYGIQVTVTVHDALRKSAKETDVLTNRQKLEHMMQKYPLIRELKEKLYLDLG